MKEIKLNNKEGHAKRIESLVEWSKTVEQVQYSARQLLRYYFGLALILMSTVATIVLSLRFLAMRL